MEKLSPLIHSRRASSTLSKTCRRQSAGEISSCSTADMGLRAPPLNESKPFVAVTTAHKGHPQPSPTRASSAASTLHNRDSSPGS
jgi:hypothetical protein